MKLNMKLCSLALVSLMLSGTIASCNSSGASSEIATKLSQAISKLRKGFKATGEVNAIKRFYDNQSYLTVYGKPENIKYSFEYVYQNANQYEGMDKKVIEYYDGQPKYLINDNVFADENGGANLNYIDYTNSLDVSEAMDEDGLNQFSYGNAGVNNPFLSIEANDFTYINGNTFNINLNKASYIMNEMFGSIDSVGLIVPPLRAVLTLNDEGNVSDITIHLMEANYLTSDYDNDYKQIYYTLAYSASIHFDEQGTANAKDALQPFETKADNEPLAEALLSIKKNDYKFSAERHATSAYDGVQNEEEEVIKMYFAKPYIYYQVYDWSNRDNITGVTASDFVMVPYSGSNPNLLVNIVRNDDGSPNGLGSWAYGPYTVLDGWSYDDFLPISEDISADLFDYKGTDDKGRKMYSLDPTMCPYWVNDGCLMSGIQNSDQEYIGYCDSVTVYVNSENKLDDVQITYWHNYVNTLKTGKYDIHYDFNETTLPYRITEEF